MLMLLILVLITLGVFLFIFNGNKKEIAISEDLLIPSQINYLEVVGIGYEPKRIENKDAIEKITAILQQLNGPVDIEHPLSDESVLGVNIVLKGHYPSSAITIFNDKIFHHKGRNVSGDLVNKLVTTIINSY